MKLVTEDFCSDTEHREHEPEPELGVSPDHSADLDLSQFLGFSGGERQSQGMHTTSPCCTLVGLLKMK